MTIFRLFKRTSTYIMHNSKRTVHAARTGTNTYCIHHCKYITHRLSAVTYYKGTRSDFRWKLFLIHKNQRREALGGCNRSDLKEIDINRVIYTEIARSPPPKNFQVRTPMFPFQMYSIVPKRISSLPVHLKKSSNVVHWYGTLFTYLESLENMHNLR